MKNLGLFIIILVISLSSCKKDNSNSDSGTGPTLTITNKQQALVMVTTATWCQYCGYWGDPDFYAAMKGDTADGVHEKVDNTGINGLELHISNEDPLYNQLAADIADSLTVGGTGVPQLWIEFNNDYNLSPSGWNEAILTRQAETNPSCAVGIDKSLSGSTYTVNVEVEFYRQMTGTYNLAVYAT